MSRYLCIFIGIFAAQQLTYADIVYTTSNIANTQSNTNVPTQPIAASQGYMIGRILTSATFVMTNSKAVIRFNTNDSNNLNFTGIRWNSYLRDFAGPSTSGIAGGIFSWSLYDDKGGVSTFSQVIKALSNPVPTFSSNVYQDGAWSLLTGSNILNKNSTYTLALTGVTINSGGRTPILDELYWTYSTSAASGGQYTLVNAGTMNSPDGTGTITSLSPAAPGVGLAFDINAVVVPEPGTLMFGLLAAFGLLCFKFVLRS